MNSKNTEKTFFEGKRPWSKIKDSILKDYLPIYLSKVSKLYRPIILIDAFAGPGVFKDGSEGSPIIMAKSAERYAKGKYLAIFVNSEEEHHTRLEKELKKVSDTALTILGTAQELLREVKKVLSNQTVFVYLDPFGLKDCEFSLLKPFLERSTSYSTEIIINMSMPTLHRLATSKAKMAGKETSQTKALNERLTKVLGGDYWKKIMWNTSLNSQEKETKVMEKYRELLSKYLSYEGSCPVKERREKRVKYFITLCSRHQDAMLLMNDIMCKAYFKQMHEIEFKGTLFEGKLDWRTTKETGDIEPIILDAANHISGKSRKDLWLSILQKHFMRWTSSEYKNSVQKLVEQGELFCPTPHKRKQLNDACLLFPKNKDFIHRSQGELIIEEPIAIYSQIKKSNKKMKIHFDEYKMVNGDVATLVSQVADGSIIKRFDKTPYPVKPTDVVCPHFLELKWAYGCPFDCSWCYLKGTFRFRPEGIEPAYKPLKKVKLHVETFVHEVKIPEILNTGEIADSLMGENGDCPFSKFIISLFQKQNRHKVLFVTKSTNVKNLLEIASPRQAIVSFSLNAKPVAEKWEKKAPLVKKRIEAAKKLFDADYEVRIRIDPMVPIEKWRESYIELINEIFLKFIPERITLGSLRGLQSTINGTRDTSWVKYLKEGSNWGRKIDFTTRHRMYTAIIEQLGNRYNYHNIALCKETKAMWEKLGLDWKRIKCNCVW